MNCFVLKVLFVSNCPKKPFFYDLGVKTAQGYVEMASYSLIGSSSYSIMSLYVFFETRLVYSVLGGKKVIVHVFIHIHIFY